MRTNIEIDDELLAEAMAATGLKTKKAVVEEALRLTVENKRRRDALDRLWGIGWEGDLDEVRGAARPCARRNDRRRHVGVDWLSSASADSEDRKADSQPAAVAYPDWRADPSRGAARGA